MNKPNYSDEEVLEIMAKIEPLGFKLDETQGFLDVVHDNIPNFRFYFGVITDINQVVKSVYEVALKRGIKEGRAELRAELLKQEQEREKAVEDEDEEINNYADYCRVKTMWESSEFIY